MFVATIFSFDRRAGYKKTSGERLAPLYFRFNILRANLPAERKFFCTILETPDKWKKKLGNSMK